MPRSSCSPVTPPDPYSSSPPLLGSWRCCGELTDLQYKVRHSTRKSESVYPYLSRWISSTFILLFRSTSSLVSLYPLFILLILNCCCRQFTESPAGLGHRRLRFASSPWLLPRRPHRDSPCGSAAPPRAPPSSTYKAPWVPPASPGPSTRGLLLVLALGISRALKVRKLKPSAYSNCSTRFSLGGGEAWCEAEVDRIGALSKRNLASDTLKINYPSPQLGTHTSLYD